jgi:hypothetical protein
MCCPSYVSTRAPAQAVQPEHTENHGWNGRKQDLVEKVDGAAYLIIR